MHRVLFEIGPLKVYSFGVLVLVAFLAGSLFARSRAPRYGWEKDRIWDVGFAALFAGILGARIVYILQDLGYYTKNPSQLLSLQFEGLTSFGGIVFGFLAVWFMARRAKKPLLSLLDVVGPAFLLANAIGRIGCLLNGCCYGAPTNLPWAIPVEGVAGTFHPAQIYDSIMNLIALGVVLVVEKRGLAMGQVFALSMAGFGISRFIYEFWRAGVTSTYLGQFPITDAQLAAGLVALIALIGFFRGGRRRAEVGEAVVP